MFNTVFVSLLFLTYANCLFPRTYCSLSTKWDVNLPIYNDQVGRIADAFADQYSKDAYYVSEEFTAEDVIEVEEVGGYLQMVKYVRGSSPLYAIERFGDWVRAASVMDEKVNLTNLYQPTEVNVRQALEYTIYGAISAYTFQNDDYQYIVVAIFEFGYSTEYAALSEAFGGRFPAHNISVEFIARDVAASPTLTTPLEKLVGEIQWAGGWSILLIRGMTVQGETKRKAMHSIFNTLNSREAWNGLVAQNKLSTLGKYESLCDLLESKGEMSGGISVAIIELDLNQKTAMQTDKFHAYSVCAYFNLIPMEHAAFVSRK